jgi:hypothetical protein
MIVSRPGWRTGPTDGRTNTTQYKEEILMNGFGGNKQDDRPKRRAIVTTPDTDLARVRAFLPYNYSAFEHPCGTICITGYDHAGWTLEDYIAPRLATGLIFIRELLANKE